MVNIFIKIVARVFFISAVGQVIFILTTPFLTRMYSPEQCGVFALFASVSSLFAGIASAKLELVMVKVASKEATVKILYSGIIISFFSALILLVLFSVIAGVTALPSLNKLFVHLSWLIPIGVLLNSWLQLFNQFLIVHNNFLFLALSKLCFFTLLSIFSLIFGYFFNYENGLIIAHLLATLCSAGLGFSWSLSYKKTQKNLNKPIIQPIKVFRQNFHFAKLAVPSDLFANVSNLSLPILFTGLYGLEIAGFFVLVQRILSLPLSLVGNIIGQIFTGVASKIFQENNRAIKLEYLTASLILGCLSAFYFIPLYFLEDNSFSFIFGTEWKELKTFVSILIPMFLFQLVVSPTSNTLLFINAENVALRINVLRIFFLTILVCVTLKSGLLLEEFMGLLVLISCVYYLSIFTFTYKKLQN